MRIGLFQVCDKNRDTVKLFGPLGLAYLAAYLNKYGDYQEICIERDLDKLLAWEPDLIGLSSYTETFTETRAIAKYIKSRSTIPLIIGGHHITGIPESLPPEIDIGVIGDGEDILLQITNKLAKQNLANISLDDVPNIVYHSNNEVKINPPSKALEIDTIPLPARHLLSHLSADFEPLLHTSRGCPFTCSFCSVFSHKVRFHSPERVVEEILDLKNNYPAQRFIHISDDIFALKNKRLFKIVDLIRSENLHKKFIFTCHARANIFDRELALLLRDMNVRYISFGFESGSENIVREVKGKFTINDNLKALKICDEINLNVNGYFIAGYPMETKEDMAKTYWFMNNNRDRIYKASLTQLTPLPGTDMWEYGLKHQVVDGINTKWENLNFGYHQTNAKIFFNEHYDYDFFQNAFRKQAEIQEILHKNSNRELNKHNFLGKNNLSAREGHYNYMIALYQKVAQLIPKIKLNILEISNHDWELDKLINLKSLLTSIPINEISRHEENEKYDLIICLHMLEQSVSAEQTFTQIITKLKPGGLIMLSFYNTQYIEYLASIIYGDWEIKPYGLYDKSVITPGIEKKFTQLIKYFKLEIRKEASLHLQSEKYPYENILKLLQTFFNLKETDLETYSYLFLLQKQA